MPHQISCMKNRSSVHRPCSSAPLRSVFSPSVLAFGSSAHASAGNTGIVAHKAFYEMQMGEKVQNSHIVSVNGRSVFAMERECSGWRSIEDYMIQFVAENGGADRVLSHFESWEADSGDKYSFDIMEESSFEGRKDFGGFVQLEGDSSGEAFFTMAPETAIGPADRHPVPGPACPADPTACRGRREDGGGDRVHRRGA